LRKNPRRLRGNKKSNNIRRAFLGWVVIIWLLSFSSVAYSISAMFGLLLMALVMAWHPSSPILNDFTGCPTLSQGKSNVIGRMKFEESQLGKGSLRQLLQAAVVF